ncbi:MAG: ABC transporter permease [Micavibrio aeruginosavorus]|uniref:ABC transporter permease n=1 Tax=Micavibrio aeruginosavorus TaxID=349221 RepID=A0A2W5FJY1_9BACT|nr:MAG: ABC transporter permease [Micavibrio aeruginosavorus]PZP56365.1 MAG: ABC transporter permease [Micavibrio aeruginosavorus]
MNFRFPSIPTVAHLCRKEWQSLFHDTVMMFFIVFSFTFLLYSQATGTSTDLKRASIGIIDEDHSPLSLRLKDSLIPPYFKNVEEVTEQQAEKGLESAKYSFVLHFPSRMEADIRAGKKVTAQLLIDATIIGQAQIGSGYINTIIQKELASYFNAQNGIQPTIDLIVRYSFNQGRDTTWFTAVTSMIQNITMLAILLTGAALIRERERGTIEHLLVMPITALEIVLSKVIANGVVILVATFLCIQLVIRQWIGVEINGSITLFLLASGLYLFFTTGLGLFLGTISRSMPQMGLLFILIVLPMNLLSGGYTPLESMPEILQKIMSVVPSTNYIKLAQGILFREAGFSIVWPQMLMVTVVGLILFVFSTIRFRSFLERQG